MCKFPGLPSPLLISSTSNSRNCSLSQPIYHNTSHIYLALCRLQALSHLSYLSTPQEEGSVGTVWPRELRLRKANIIHLGSQSLFAGPALDSGILTPMMGMPTTSSQMAMAFGFQVLRGMGRAGSFVIHCRMLDIFLSKTPG